MPRSKNVRAVERAIDIHQCFTPDKPCSIIATNFPQPKPPLTWLAARREAGHSKTASLALQPSLGGPKLH